jgi:hypothetical protein
MSVVLGARLGPYEILGAIGAGGMGEVYKARDTRLDRTVAIKVLPAHVSANPERRARFEREAKTIAGLNHPHICTLHDVGEHEGSTFLVMEHLTGETLAQRLEKGPLPLEQADQALPGKGPGGALAGDPRRPVPVEMAPRSRSSSRAVRTRGTRPQPRTPAGPTRCT